MKVLLYGRQSSGDDEQSESVDLQLSKLKALAASRGWERDKTDGLIS